MIIDHRYTDSTDSCDCITSTIPQIGDLLYLCNRAYAEGDKNLCICGEFSHAQNLTQRSIVLFISSFWHAAVCSLPGFWRARYRK
jgi:hypothetical protein